MKTKYLSAIEMSKQLNIKDREKFLIGGTSVRPNDVIQKMISGLGAKNVIEIGTGFGTATIAIASCTSVEKVISFDVKPSVYQEYLARHFQLQNKIQFITANNSQEIYEIMAKYEFDFAYIDGGHIPPFPADDFKACKTIGRILMDDAWSKHVGKVIQDNKGIMIGLRFGYWAKDGEYTIAEKIGSEIKTDDIVGPDGKLQCDYSYLYI